MSAFNSRANAEEVLAAVAGAEVVMGSSLRLDYEQVVRSLALPCLITETRNGHAWTA